MPDREFSESSNQTEQQPNQNPDSGDGNGAAPHDDVHYDDSQIRMMGVGCALFAIAASFLVVGGVSWWLLKGTVQPSGQRDEGSYRRPSAELPPEPRLHPLENRTEGLPDQAFVRRVRLEQALHEYGRTAEPGFIQIPIEKAIEVAAQTLPVRKQTHSGIEKSYGLLGGGESSSGRFYEDVPPWYTPEH